MTSTTSPRGLQQQLQQEQAKLTALALLDQMKSLIQASSVLDKKHPGTFQYSNPFGVGEMEPEQWLLFFFFVPAYEDLASSKFELVKQAHNISPYFEQVYQHREAHPDYQQLIRLLVDFEETVKQL